VPRKLICFSLLAILFAGCSSKETYRSGGRTASYWAKALKEPDVDQRRKAAVKIGPLTLTDEAALPALIAALKDEDSKVRLAAIRSLKIYATGKTAQILPPLRDVKEKDSDAAVRDAASGAIEALNNQ
jgi:HEAT repeat protein